MSETTSAKKLKDKKTLKKYVENSLDFLVSLIDNGGRRSCVERRQDSRFMDLSDKESTIDRRKSIDRRKQQNQKRANGSERRAIFKNDG
jgi:hypothetical protein